MSLIVPNATDTVGGAKFQAIDQAEPDSLDFEILGADGNGVVSGCGVTSASSASVVNVAAGVVIVGGAPYTLAAVTGFAVPSFPADNRFDLIIARLSGGSVSVVGIQGTNSSTNPTYPKSASVITAAFSPTTNVDLSTDVVLAAIYRSGNNVLTASRIIDKRVVRISSVYDQGIGAPAGGYGVAGNLYIDTAAPALYFKTGASTWNGLNPTAPSSLVPIGVALPYPVPATTPVPPNYFELDGSSKSTTTYAALFAVYAYTHGGSGGTFNLPNWNEKSIRGTTVGAKVGTTTGVDSVTIAIANLPVHAHDMAAHTHGFVHTHGIDHAHTGSTDAQGSHQHYTSGTTSGQSNSHAHYPLTGAADPNMRFVTQSISAGGPSAFNVSAGTGAYVHSDVVTELTLTDHTHTWGAWSSLNGSHAHNITINTYFGSTVSQSTSTTGAPSTANTGNVGSGTAISVVPLSAYTRWIVRYA